MLDRDTLAEYGRHHLRQQPLPRVDPDTRALNIFLIDDRLERPIIDPPLHPVVAPVVGDLEDRLRLTEHLRSLGDQPHLAEFRMPGNPFPDRRPVRHAG